MMNFIAKDLARCIETINSIVSSNVSTSDAVKAFTVCLEDRRYYNHPGYDLVSIVRALSLNVLGINAGGASTIEQQLVRTITGRYERKISRKVKEILLARSISRVYDKETLLDAYLGIAYFGHELTGAKCASLSLFNSDANDLGLAEAATIASLLLCPVPRARTDHWWHRVERRAIYAVRVAAKVRSGASWGEWTIGFHDGSLTLASMRLKRHLENLSVSLASVENRSFRLDPWVYARLRPASGEVLQYHSSDRATKTFP